MTENVTTENVTTENVTTENMTTENVTTENVTTENMTRDVDLVRAERRLRDLLERSEQQLLELESSLTGMLRDHDTIQEDRDGARLVVDAIRADVRHTRRALQRVDDGTYGTCVGCGSAIHPDRLEAIPVADRCGRCA
jgi:DnaK suppressor protein